VIRYFVFGKSKLTMRLHFKSITLVPLCGGVCALLNLWASAQSVPQPVLTIAPTNGTQFQLTITNAVATTNYEIYRTPLLSDTNFPWTLHMVGYVGQSNFIVDTEVYGTSFFRAGIGSDWDLDGVFNDRDANPFDATIGILTITIDSPTNGSTIN
jgi:hypothetical protein